MPKVERKWTVHNELSKFGRGIRIRTLNDGVRAVDSTETYAEFKPYFNCWCLPNVCNDSYYISHKIMLTTTKFEPPLPKNLITNNIQHKFLLYYITERFDIKVPLNLSQHIKGYCEYFL